MTRYAWVWAADNYWDFVDSAGNIHATAILDTTEEGEKPFAEIAGAGKLNVSKEFKTDFAAKKWLGKQKKVFKSKFLDQ